MAAVRNFLFIMCDQLRADYLSCAGHPFLETPHIDRLAARGVQFSRAYCQSPICGPSRMSFYTGRYMFSHGSTWNFVPLRVDELTMGDYLRPHGLRVALVGKTHMYADLDGMARVELDPASAAGTLIAECGFEPYERDDGLHGGGRDADPDLAYNRYLRAHGYSGENPWRDHANAARGPNGEVLPWHDLENCRLPAGVAEEHSETAYMTNRAIEFIEECGADPWALHLSYIKPHWPYMAPAPYHDIYGANQVLPVNRDPRETQDPHPVVEAFMNEGFAQALQQDAQRQAVIPAYMGLIKQIDNHLGRLLAFLEEQGRMADTMIVFTSDHGDYLGDHWLGEKELFHEESARIPMIVYDPDPSADPTRGTVDERFVESIDLIPTFLDCLDGDLYSHRLEGRSLRPLIRDEALERPWRDAAFSETDYAFRRARAYLGVAPDAARAFMVRRERWKYIYYEGFRPQLFDLENDPRELDDLGASPAEAEVRADLHERLFAWLRTRRLRTTISNESITGRF